ncbi:murein biosynthesis integral membrane protein MurJ [Candidatus Uhrbacteria bacterium]|nr:murein biosynthesis integral membrane protein MurJ [Candidatus Uhrbacteria bacterium]
MLRWLSRIFNGQTDGITAAALIVGASSLLSRVLGIVRDRVLAGTFGAGDALDAYYAAFRLPDTVYNLVILGAISAGFIPVFTEYLEKKGKSEAAKIAGQILSTVGVILVAGSILVFIFAPWILPFIVPGFSSEKLSLTVELTRIMTLSPVFLGLSAVIGGVMQSLKRYVGFALAPIMYNAGIIGGTLILGPSIGILGAAWGVVVGAFLHLIVQAAAFSDFSMMRLPVPTLKSEAVRKILSLMGPRTAALGVSQLSLVILLGIATTLPAGSVAVYNLANNLQSFPLGVFGISFAIAAFPLLSQAASRSDDAAFRAALTGAARKIAFFILPATAAFILLRAQIVRLVLGMGEFDWSDTIRTADVVALLALSLIAQSIVPLLTRAFYARQNTWTPFWITAIGESLTIVLALWFRTSFGLLGLAAAVSISITIQCLLLVAALRKQFGSLGRGEFMYSVYRNGVATIAFCVAGFPVREWLGTVFPLRTFWQVALQFSAAFFAGMVAFCITAWLMKSPEWKELSEAIRQRLWKKAKLMEVI